MASELLEKRWLFSESLALLLGFMRLRGYRGAVDQVKRTQAEAAANAAAGSGISNSLHIDGLAGDVNLYKDGVYLADTSHHLLFGAFWKSLGPLHRWGGDFKDAQGRPKPDGNHYSIEHEGRK